MAKRATKSTKTPEKPEKNPISTGQPVTFTKGDPAKSAGPVVSFQHGDAVEIRVPAAVAAGCVKLATGVDCPDSAVAITLTPPRAGRDSVLSLRFVTSAAADDFAASISGG